MTESPHLTAAEAAAYLKFDSIIALRKWAIRHRVPKKHRGRTLLFCRADLDRALELGTAAAGVFLAEAVEQIQQTIHRPVPFRRRRSG